ncbi:capsule assembly Wzi family protein [Sediminibacterium sp.]|uniref:capsule assembly Wzi family protein n=1 Tax=Sediminibacterium sp. TaxID=1917865 RepID=UPI002735304D|nr:capsule assembly Wzi family protein [Sediminibacterium sp.]MDP3392427.1 capsule assembly Wzi family protein [Sediminibacterium sp.]MDP3565693.1 capsule assembly Wzi family protein [Sediminibacterium sp.]
MNNLQSQSYTLESINQNQLRNQQLLGNHDSTVSFSNQFNTIIAVGKSNWKKSSFTLLPFVFTQQLNTHHPFGWNDGAMIQAKGYQVLARPGVNMQYGIFEVQLAPELVFASNGNYATPQYGNHNNNSYSKIFPGQSFVKANYGAISLGVSTQNLWWGPGIHSSLLMSNNAPGFLHAFIGTRKPIKTPIGNIEFNLIGARLTSTSSIGFENNHLQPRYNGNIWRYLNSYVISWQPKWIKGLFLGMTRSLQQYGEESLNRPAGFISKYLPIIGLPLEKANYFGDDTLRRDQLASFFLRWVLPKANAEFYVEYGKNDYGVNFRDYINGPTHSSAYTAGFRKLIPKSAEKYIQLETEITQMSQSPDYLVRDAGNWYVHGQIGQGYTHENQIMGAGAGFGANLQTFSATWVNGNLRNGFLIQRIERDPENRVNKWTDFSIGWIPQWRYKNMILGAKVQLIRSNNYSWEKGNNPFNLHSRLMIQYNFK